MQEETFDFIVTGAGSAGCAVAARLVEVRPLPRAAAGGRRPRQQPVDPHPARLHQDLHQPAGQLDVRERAARRSSTAAPSTSRAARCWAAPARSTAWSTCAAPRPITTTGASAAARAGTGIACCRSSRRPRTRSAAPTSSTASAGRCSVSDPPLWPLGDAMVEAAVEAGIPRNPDFNGAQPGRRRLLPDDDQQRAAAGARPGLSAAGAQPAAT